MNGKRLNRKCLVLLLSVILVISTMVAIVSASDWPQFQKDKVNTGWTADSAPANDPALVWWKQTSGTGMGGIDVTPIVADAAIVGDYVIYGDDKVYALWTRTFWEGNVTLLENTTFNVTAHNSGKSYELNQTTALGALDAASEAGEFNYTINDTWYPAMGLYVDSIAGKECEGMEGWQYWVNYPTDPKPVTSVDKYAVRNGDVVTYYYGEWTTTPDNSSMVIRIHALIAMEL